MNLDTDKPEFRTLFAVRNQEAMILMLVAVYFWLPPCARAVNPPMSVAESNVFSATATGLRESNAMLRPSHLAVTDLRSNSPTADAPKVPDVSSGVPPNCMDALDNRHKLNIGDRLSFRIIEDEDDPKEVLVTDSGDVEVPYIGRCPAVGKTCKELALKLKAELEKDYYYHATVIVAVNEWARSQGKVYIVGPVHSPGPQEVPSDEVLTLSKAILRAGGFADYADEHKVEVRRQSIKPGKDDVFTVDVAQILNKGKTEADLPLEPGDLIYVPERLIRF